MLVVVILDGIPEIDVNVDDIVYLIVLYCTGGDHVEYPLSQESSVFTRNRDENFLMYQFVSLSSVLLTVHHEDSF